MSVLCKQKYQIVSAKAVVQVDFHAFALSMHKKCKQRTITLTELAPSPFYSNTNVHLVDINVFAKLDEIPSSPVQVIKEKPKWCGQRNTKCNNSDRLGL